MAGDVSHVPVERTADLEFFAGFRALLRHRGLSLRGPLACSILLARQGAFRKRQNRLGKEKKKGCKLGYALAAEFGSVAHNRCSPRCDHRFRGSKPQLLKWNSWLPGCRPGYPFRLVAQLTSDRPVTALSFSATGTIQPRQVIPSRP